MNLGRGPPFYCSRLTERGPISQRTIQGSTANIDTPIALIAIHLVAKLRCETALPKQEFHSITEPDTCLRN